MLKVSRAFLMAGAMLFVSGCMLGANYQRPEQPLPEQFTEIEGWKHAEPADLADKGPWWQLYQDELLTGMLHTLDASNQNLAAAEAAWREAQAALGSTRSELYPQLSAQGSSTRSAQGRDQITKNKNVQLGLSWQLDLWGQVRRQVEAGQARADASAADWAALRLSLQAQLVQNYIQLRTLDEQIRIVQRNLDAYARVLKITENRYQSGMVTKADTSQALTQFRSTEAQLLDLNSQRRRLQHSIALLLGQPATGFQVSAQAGLPAVPVLPKDIPSSLLERRPDIAAAERRVMAANAEIGVARTAYFPSFSLNASGGYRSEQWSGLLNTPNRFWSIGPQFDLRLFDAGARRARSQQAQASYDQQVAKYRQTTLEAIVEVEDALVQLLSLQDEYRVQAQASAAAQEALQLIENQYQAGMVDFLAVSSAQTTALNAERTLLDLQARQLTASVQLISALGGGWHQEIIE
ncbi:efflux transporter outer membrane subunit [Thiopseudomonas acetoxidans]|uniref:Efflux transporter outer membrane subunit n=1 Tax=Thiopseudomonas acetoxidans TaxID=3041622 RepID=A0ABT7SMS3_9GAMM|nr:efflux transporter outer membrane subunit [Thiopseudomonas sp. CY1220]MDM7857486.1 efflux transporter outer membrane subunit [Thiopseudomonas sp. CY1220]